MTDPVTFAAPVAATWYRHAFVGDLVVTWSRLDRWQRRWLDVGTDWRTFLGVQVAGWYVGVCR